MPAARSCRASSTIAVPSQVAPPARAARAHGISPWPYPSAFTTAIRSAGVPAFSVATLARMACEVDDGFGTQHLASVSKLAPQPPNPAG